MDINALLQNLSPEIYEKLRQSVETGKWLDGSPLTEHQAEMCMQAVMMYQSKVLKSEEHMTIGENGEVVHKSRDAFKQEFSSSTNNNSQTIARFKQDDL